MSVDWCANVISIDNDDDFSRRRVFRWVVFGYLIDKFFKVLFA
jgi:hypothetical protein